MFFRGKRVCAVCLSPESEDEADYLESIGCEVVRLRTQDVRINGEGRVASVTADGDEIICDGVFVLRQAVAPHLLLANLEMQDGYIKTGISGETNIPGVFAAGDCTGTPHQIARATGQGLTAALAADEYIKKSEMASKV
jgi:thioredoxin reductase (NADPH)